jgi:hypothetical protein
MPYRKLRVALAAFAEEAGAHLAADAAGGAAIPFEIVSSAGRRHKTPLYCYRPLTVAFIDERVASLAGLPTYLPALQALSAVEGLGAYLESRGQRPVPAETSDRAAAALHAFLSRVFEDSSDFALVPGRLEPACAELEAIVRQGRTEMVVVAPVVGLTLKSEQVALGDGLSLVQGATLPDAPPEALDDAASVVAVLASSAPPGGEVDPVGPARVRLRRLLTALRLYADPKIQMGPLAWTRTAGGVWHAIAGLGGGGQPPVKPFAVARSREDDLRAFCSLVARRTPATGEVAWALGRFEMGCERSPVEALTDHLLALRALLAPEGGADILGRRTAALCAGPEQQPALAERISHAVSIERAIVGGLPPAEIALLDILDEVAGRLRAILRDVLSGHLDSDVRSVADRLLAEARGESAAVA